ncbi:hypothetical protein G3I40_33050 [Streptomyces sp. SID14478]|uniref:hypothetical protein n=1 Tax=Streptomyces sp. SID14478 TaxID=2706073 RepID=UPI0013D9D3D8|nr:hypothetical protein [Streptomyces sp. SID14478]NEB80010.1 hypothetical protein [Streptomyces sp. SID14478]
MIVCRSIAAALTTLAAGGLLVTPAHATPDTVRSATVPLVTCSGSHTVDFTEALTDTPSVHHGTATFNDGSANLISEVLGNTYCKPDPNAPAGVSQVAGLQAKINFTQTVACTQSGNNDGTFTGTAKWLNGTAGPIATDQLTNGKFLLEEGEHGNSVVKLRATVSSTNADRDGRTIDFVANGNSKAPNACETNGVKQLTGTHGIELY